MSQGSRQEVSRAVRARLEEGVSDCSRVKLECEEETLCQLIVYGSADSTGGDVTGLKRHQRQGRASLQRMLARLLPAASLCPVSEADADQNYMPRSHSSHERQRIQSISSHCKGAF